MYCLDSVTYFPSTHLNRHHIYVSHASTSITYNTWHDLIQTAFTYRLTPFFFANDYMLIKCQQMQSGKRKMIIHFASSCLNLVSKWKDSPLQHTFVLHTVMKWKLKNLIMCSWGLNAACIELISMATPLVPYFLKAIRGSSSCRHCDLSRWGKSVQSHSPLQCH